MLNTELGLEIQSEPGERGGGREGHGEQKWMDNGGAGRREKTSWETEKRRWGECRKGRDAAPVLNDAPCATRESLTNTTDSTMPYAISRQLAGIPARKESTRRKRIQQSGVCCSCRCAVVANPKIENVMMCDALSI